jgi:hypothetical protein
MPIPHVTVAGTMNELTFLAYRKVNLPGVGNGMADKVFTGISYGKDRLGVTMALFVFNVSH